MHSAVITSERSQPAVLLAEQLAHQRSVRPGPLVLGTALLKSPAHIAVLARPAYQRGGLPRPLLPRGNGKPHLEVGFPLRCFQRLSHPDVANQQRRWHDD